MTGFAGSLVAMHSFPFTVAGASIPAELNLTRTLLWRPPPVVPLVSESTTQVKSAGVEQSDVVSVISHSKSSASRRQRYY